MSIPFYLITGFLGSGKTTLLKGILDYFGHQKKVAVIENEFADRGIDTIDLNKGDNTPYRIIELNKGSVFCACLLPEFTYACEQLGKDFELDAIILEATGLADPIAVGQILRKPPLDKMLYLAMTICISDAVSFLKLEKLILRMQHQVRVADHVLVNKCDLVTTEHVQNIHERIRALNPFCKITDTSFCKFIPDDLFGADSDSPIANTLDNIDSAGRPPISSTVIRTTKKISKDNLSVFLDSFKDAYRIKGFVNIIDKSKNSDFAIQYASDTLRMHPILEHVGPTELVILSPHHESNYVESYFLRLCDES